MSNEKMSANEVLQEMREWDRFEEWPSDLITLTRWADAFAALIAERDAYRIRAEEMEQTKKIDLRAAAEEQERRISELRTALDAARANEST